MHQSNYYEAFLLVFQTGILKFTSIKTNVYQ
eukprot:CAMPEP_0182431646 /NCGR_PEP_ID=MMETSP1167-20130531/50832_1 /TAXON_ID=2988 /ORGANISM="Mallomonas Sp, Strain CCMP3275" /LENGTH=30 /DNA_ID= /DNA_START= /DNA_END= /DNA_ORIENTATION=